MNQDQWQIIQDLFNTLVDLPVGEQQSKLSILAKKKPEIAEEVQALLEEDAVPLPIFNKEYQDWKQSEASMVGQSVGTFTLLTHISSGGMGSVFKAERTDGEFEQVVAVKLLRASLIESRSVELFRQERQLLASLQHPNIAQLFDGGLLPNGRPYFTMELVQGTSITNYAKKEQLSIPDRIRLFEQVGEAVRYAHQKLILHLDLKPSNVLVNESGKVKLLDFGVSKLITEAAIPGNPYTLAYAPPELINGEAVSTASDVYALGILLYELLTGVHPYAHELAATNAPKRVVASYQPPLPSAQNDMVSTLFAGDLDAIIQHAIQKTPADRYTSVDAMLADLNAYLHHSPVSVRKNKVTYRLRKYFKRNQSLVSLTALFSILLLSGGIFYTLELNKQRERALLEAEKANQIKELTIGIFEQTNPVVAGEPDISARNILDNSVTSIEEKLKDQPELLPEMYHIIGNAYQMLSVFDEAEKVHQKGLTVSQSLSQAANMTLARSYLENGIFYAYEFSDFQKADSFFLDALATYSRSKEKEPRLYADIIRELGVNALTQLYLENALDYLHQAEQVYETLPTDHSDDIAYCINYIGATYIGMQEWDKAEAALFKAKRLYEQVHKPPHVDLALNLDFIVNLYKKSGRPEKAVPFAKASVAQYEVVLGKNHPSTLASLNNLGQIYRKLNRLEEAKATLKASYEGMQEVMGKFHTYTIAALLVYAEMEFETGKEELGLSLVEEAIDRQNVDLLQDDFRRTYPLSVYSKLLLKVNRPDDAYPVIKEGYEIRNFHLDSTDFLVVIFDLYLGEYYTQKEDWEQANIQLQKAKQFYQQDTIAYAGNLAHTMDLLTTVDQHLSEK